MQIAATVRNTRSSHEVEVRTAQVSQQLRIAAKSTGRGSSVNGGEFLMLALATCYCNDLYREAERLAIDIDSAEVEAWADFNGVGMGASNIRYRATVQSSADPVLVERLIRDTDAVAEVHNTIRAGVPVRLVQS